LVLVAAQVVLYLLPLVEGEQRRLVFPLWAEVSFKAPLGAEVVEDLTAPEPRKSGKVAAHHS
jgi:hypothetical protein